MAVGMHTVVPAICYESLTPQPLDQAMQLSATVYLACVAKPEEGVVCAHSYVSGAAKKSGLLVLMCNAVGPSDDFLSSGQSAAWDEHGNLLAMLDDSQEALLVIDPDGAGASCQKINVS